METTRTSPWHLLRERLADRAPVGLRATWRVAPRSAIAAAAVALAVVGGAAARAVLAPDAGPAAIRIAQVRAPAELPTGQSEPVALPGERQPPADLASGLSGAGTSGTLGAGSQVVVDVVGQVRRPGLVRLPAGSRVADAVAAAGGSGPQAALDQLNLARVLTDGEQIVVPRPGQLVSPPSGPAGKGVPSGGSGSGAAGPGGVLDLNQAGESQLVELPGIGPVLAGRILAWRAQHGRFSTVDELAEVGGIGDKLLADLRPMVRV